MDDIKTLIEEKKNNLKRDTVNSNINIKTAVNSYNSNTVNSSDDEQTKDKYSDERIQEIFDWFNAEPEYFAEQLANELSDTKSLKYYLLLVKNNNTAQLLEALHITIDADRNGQIRTKKAVYFISIIRRWGLKTKFRDK